jgi:hypothetical protein
MSDDGTLVEAIDGLIESRNREIMTAIPGRVESYDSATQKADVQPLIQRPYTDETGARVAETPPVVPGVPVQFMGAGGFRITFPIVKGDLVLLVFCHSSIAKWLKNGGVVNPNDDRHHDPSDAVAIPGLHFFGGASDQVADGAMVLSGDIKLGSKDASDPAVGKSHLDALKSAITSAAVVAGDGGAALKANILAAWTPSGSTKVEIE